MDFDALYQLYIDEHPGIRGHSIHSILCDKQFMYAGRPRNRRQIVELRVSHGWTVQDTDFDGRCLVSAEDPDVILDQARITKTAIDYAAYLTGVCDELKRLDELRDRQRSELMSGGWLNDADEEELQNLECKYRGID